MSLNLIKFQIISLVAFLFISTSSFARADSDILNSETDISKNYKKFIDIDEEDIAVADIDINNRPLFSSFRKQFFYQTVSVVASSLSFYMIMRARGYNVVYSTAFVLAVDLYRSYKCFDLGYKGLQELKKLHNISSNFEISKFQLASILNSSKLSFNKNTSSHLILKKDEEEIDSLNKEMYGYLSSDLFYQTAISFLDKFRPEIFLHHGLGMAAWGFGYNLSAIKNILATNAVVELVTMPKIFETLSFKLIKNANINKQQYRILYGLTSLTYAYRLAVTALFRFPIWYPLDFYGLSNSDGLSLSAKTGFPALLALMFGLECKWFFDTGTCFMTYCNSFWHGRDIRKKTE